MSTRIATPLMFAQGVDVMLRKQTEISRTQLQLASGDRILSPSDDVSASVRLLDLQESKAKLDQYQRNADAAGERLNVEETALEGIANLLQRVRELTVQGNNGTMNAEDRKSIAAEIQQQLEGYVSLVNTRDSNGEYIFSGYASDQQAIDPATLAYNTNTGQRLVKVGDSRQVAAGDAADIFQNLTAAAGGTTDIASILSTIAANFDAGNPDPNALADLDTAIDRISTTRASVGARLNAVEEQKRANESFGVAVEQVRSTLKDLDYAEAVSRFNQQLAALQASQQSFLKIQDLNLFNFLR